MSEPLLQQRWPWIAAAAVVVLGLLSTMIRVPESSDWDDRPTGSIADFDALRERDDVNVLFLLIDTLRAERLGSYGYERDTSPVLDGLTGEGVRFARHLSQSSWTKASMASLWTGLLPLRAGITRFDHLLPDDAVMPAERFKEAGFQTVGLFRNGWVAPTFGFDQGFDVYKKPFRQGPGPNMRRKNPTLSEANTDESLISAALEFLRLRGNERWFLYIHMMDVHEYTYDEESAIFGASYADIYDSSILWTDGVLEVLFSSMGDMGLLDDTIIVIASDHGEAFGERGFEGHARKVYRETTEVPFIVLLPFRLDPGLVIETRTSNVDIWPTIFDMIGLDPGETDGESRVPEIRAGLLGEAPEEPVEIAVSHLDQTWARPGEDPKSTISVVEGSLRYVRVDQQDRPTVEQLFDSEGDPRELEDHATERAETVERLGKVADEYLELSPDWGEPPTREVSELELNHLRALGYAIP